MNSSRSKAASRNIITKLVTQSLASLWERGNPRCNQRNQQMNICICQGPQGLAIVGT